MSWPTGNANAPRTTAFKYCWITISQYQEGSLNLGNKRLNHFEFLNYRACLRIPPVATEEEYHYRALDCLYGASNWKISQQNKEDKQKLAMKTMRIRKLTEMRRRVWTGSETRLTDSTDWANQTAIPNPNPHKRWTSRAPIADALFPLKRASV